MSSLGFPWLAFSPIRAPPGYGHQSILATLSKHSPAASSRVDHSFVRVRGQKFHVETFQCCSVAAFEVFWTRYISLCQPDAVNMIRGKGKSCIDLSRRIENIWP